MESKNMILKATVEYRGMHSSFELEIDENQNTCHYLEEIKDHVEISKKVIDRRHEKYKVC